jgi:3,4-dihydroxy 2-butanone 4-phosphate synthase/GTP cyclohydrolase II
LKQISVADLIAYRQARERLVERIHSFPVETEVGTVTGHTYVTPFDPVHHFAFVYGNVGDGRDVAARLHRANVVTDVFAGAKMLHAALVRFQRDGRGVLVYLRDGATGVPVTPAPEVGSDARRMRQWREIGLGAQILKDLGVSSIRNLVSSPQGYVGLSGFGIEITATEIVEA